MNSLTSMVMSTLLGAGLLSADVTYSQTTKFKGGTMVDMMQKMANNPMMAAMGGGMKQAFQDQQYDIYIKGNKMARWGKVTSTIYDLDAGTVTTLNNAKQTYSVSTFDEMKQRADQAEKRMNRGQSGGDLEFDVKVDKTGQTKMVGGETATESVITMKAKQASAQGQMVVVIHAWAVTAKPAMKEVVEFQRKLSEKYADALSGMGPGMSSAAKGMTAAMKELGKQDGYPVETETSISGVSGGPMGAMGAMGGGAQPDPTAPMMIVESDSDHFVQGGVDDSKFAIPAGFKEEKRGGAGRFAMPQ